MHYQQKSQYSKRGWADSTSDEAKSIYQQVYQIFLRLPPAFAYTVYVHARADQKAKPTKAERIPLVILWYVVGTSRDIRLCVKGTLLLLVRDGASSKWPPVHKGEEQLSERQSNGVDKAYWLNHFTTLFWDVWLRKPNMNISNLFFFLSICSYIIKKLSNNCFTTRHIPFPV